MPLRVLYIGCCRRKSRDCPELARWSASGTTFHYFPRLCAETGSISAIFRQDVPWFRLQRRAEPTTGRTRHLTGACVAVLCSGDELALCGMKAIGSIWLNSWPRDLFALLSLQKLLGPGIGAPLKNPRCFARCVCQTKMDRFHF